MKKLILMTAMISTVALGACETFSGAGNKELIGGGGGAVLGGLAGSQVGSGSGRLWATGAGVLLGALAGSSVGRSLDKADMAYANQASYQAHNAPIGQAISWNNPDSGNYGTVTPVRDGRDASGAYCREYQQTIYVGGKQENGYGTACKQANGSWKIVS